jgi:hypothetical protein
MRPGKLRELRWVAARPSEPRAPLQASLTEAITALGVPRAPEPLASSPRDEAVFLLQVGAEIEHALLAQYLYAAYSLDRSQDAPARWQEEILEIAREEMGHLITVQNLLLLLGEGVYLERENYPLHTELYPFPLSLEPLHPESLAKYVIAESPSTTALPPELRKIAQQAGDVNHVGVVYAMIYWIFQATDAPQGPFHLPEGIPFPTGHHLTDGDFVIAEIDQRQTSKQEWGAGGPAIRIDKAGTRAAALEALSRIALQGEGLTDEDDSHFQRFLRIHQELMDFLRAGGANYVRDVPTHPTTASPPRPGGGGPDGHITHPGTLRWAEMFNRRYELLLLDIKLAMSYKSGDMVQGTRIRPRLAKDWAVQMEMTKALSQIARTLTMLPKDDVPAPAGPRFAGAPFELPEAGLPVDVAGCWRRQLELIDECERIITDIGLDHDNGARTLRSVRTFDRGRRSLVETLADTGGHP